MYFDDGPEGIYSMNFIVGLAVGALGMWAYRSGKMQNLVGRAPAPVCFDCTHSTQRPGAGEQTGGHAIAPGFGAGGHLAQSTA